MCTCLPHFSGDANSANGCTPECLSHDDCDSDKACINSFCIDPCPGACGIDSLCKVVAHRPVCACPKGYAGNPYTRCEQPLKPIIPGKIPPDVPSNPCVPPPCGVNTECKVEGSKPVCSCIPGYVGNPNTSCRPECVTNIDCNHDKACIDQKCRDPCVGICGTNALCEVVNHNPICFCPKDLTGDPFRLCLPIREYLKFLCLNLSRIYCLSYLLSFIMQYVP